MLQGPRSLLKVGGGGGRIARELCHAGFYPVIFLFTKKVGAMPPGSAVPVLNNFEEC